jgi:hypothetical protein
MHFLHISPFIQLPLLEDIFHMAGDDRLIPLEQIRHLPLRQPDSVLLQPNFQPNAGPIRFIENNATQRVLTRGNLADTQRLPASPPDLCRLIGSHTFLVELKALASCELSARDATPGGARVSDAGLRNFPRTRIRFPAMSSSIRE